MKIGTEVVAVKDMKLTSAHRYRGPAKYLGYQVPDTEPYRTMGFEDECYKLETGQYVWGHELDWAPDPDEFEAYCEKKQLRIIEHDLDPSEEIKIFREEKAG